MSNKMAPDLGKLDELAKVHALSYASPHHFTMSVNGLREVIAELQLPAGNKMALDARGEIRKDMPSSAYKMGDEFKPFHPSASHVSPEWRDGWNACFIAAIAALQASPQPEALLNAVTAEVERLVAQSAPTERDAQDAARYRWLRSVPNAFKAQRIVNDTPHGMDATIDAAMNGGNQ